MNKFTKLLSVFVIAGAVSCGVAGLAGCGSNGETHTHNGTYHEAVAATCTEAGNVAYYTCDDAGCAGKYFSDEACTQEITNIVIAATGHTEVYTDKGNGTHGITCEHDDLTETTEAHSDEDHDGKCDDCNVKIIEFGKYYELSGSVTFQMELKAGYKLVYNGTEYNASSLLTSNTVVINDNGVEHTITKTEYGYSDKYTTNGNSAVLYWNKLNEEIATDIEEFVGVYEGEYNYVLQSATYKVTKFVITSTGMIQFTDAQVYTENGEEKTKPAIVSLKDGTNGSINYNDFQVDNWHFIATKAEGGQVTEILLTIDGIGAAKFVKTNETVSEVPSSLGLEEKTIYSGTDTEDQTYTFVSNASTANYKYTLNDIEVKLISGNATDGYLIISFGVNYVIKINGTTVELYAADGTKIADLTKVNTSIPVITEAKADGETVLTEGNQNPFCGYSNYYYQVATAGYYTFSANSSSVTIYTEVDSETFAPTASGATVLNIASGEKQYVHLEAGSYIALDEASNTAGFKVLYSATEPEPDYESLTDGVYTINSFNGNNTYYVKAAVETAGKYYVSVAWTAIFDDNNKGAYFEIGDTKYGYTYNSNTWAVADSGLTYSATLAAEDEVKIKIGCDNQYLLNGYKVVVYFETETEYNARLADETATPTFSGTQLGKYEDDGNVYEVTATGITLTDEYGTKTLTFVCKKVGAYYYSLNGNYYAFNFNENGTLDVTVSGYTSTLYKLVEVTFTEEQQGTYLGVYKYESGYTNTFKYVIDESTVTCNGYKLSCIANNDGVYTYKYGSYFVTFNFVNGNMNVTSDDWHFVDATAYVASKLPTVSFDEDQQGQYAYAVTAKGGGTSYIIYTIGKDSLKTSGYTLTCLSIKDGVYTFINSSGNELVFSFADGKMSITTDDINNMTDAFEASKLPTASFDEGQQGTYAYVSDSDAIIYIVGANTVSTSGYYGEALTCLSINEGVYTFIDSYGYTITFKFEAGNMVVTEDNIAGTSEGYTASKLPTASFTEDQQGTYNYTYFNFDFEYVITADSVTYSYGYGALECTLLSINDDVYTFDCNGKQLQFKFVNGDLYVISDPMGATGYTAVKAGSSTGTVNKVENGGNLALGDNEVTTYDGYSATVYLTASETLPAGTYTLTFTELYSMSLYINDTMVLKDGTNISVDVTLGSEPVKIAFAYNDSNTTINVAAKVNEVENGGSLALGDNEVTTYDGYSATVYLTASETLPAGTYTLTFTELYSMSLYINDTMVLKDGTNISVDVTLGSEPVKIAFAYNDSNTTINVAAKVNEVENGGSLALGDNEVTTYDGYSATVYLTASETLPAGTYTLTISNIWSGSLYVGGVSTADDGKGNATVEVTLGDTPIAIKLDQPNSGNASIVVATKA
ncbi:MAG: hypothetical protein ACI4VK_03740 [Candidatus Coproplasma sp.]